MFGDSGDSIDNVPNKRMVIADRITAITRRLWGLLTIQSPLSPDVCGAH
jgi:hypothetical protein